MTENTQTPAELVKQARKLDEWPDYPPIIGTLADALESVLAERDALAAILAEASHDPYCLAVAIRREPGPCDCWKSKLPADALAARDARMKAAALREAADEVYGDARAEGPYSNPLSIATWLRSEADRIEREARS